MTPAPNRGKTNIPAFIVHTIKQISDILNVDESEVEKITSDNFLNLFRKVETSSIS